MVDYFRQILLETIQWTHSQWVVELVLLLGVAVAAAATYFITDWILEKISGHLKESEKVAVKTILDPGMLKKFSLLAPALTVNAMLPTFFVEETPAHRWIKILTSLYILITTLVIISYLKTNLLKALEQDSRYRKYAIKGAFQMFYMTVVVIGIIIAISIVMSIKPAVIFTGLGASAAVLMLVFKDTILGFVATVQFANYQMLKRGDWVVCESHAINGRVKEVNLTNVKVKNWDNSISNIPPYTLASASFRNYSEMFDGKARRVDRSILIDVTTIRFLTPEELAELQEAGMLDSLNVRLAERMVNITLLRRYLKSYLEKNQRVVHRELTMVRQLEMTPAGLPLQLYFFTKSTEWSQFEQVQSDIFDHVYAIINRFGLRIYQSPTGRIN